MNLARRQGAIFIASAISTISSPCTYTLHLNWYAAFGVSFSPLPLIIRCDSWSSMFVKSFSRDLLDIFENRYITLCIIRYLEIGLIKPVTLHHLSK